jgi:hypothetical protein
VRKLHTACVCTTSAKVSTPSFTPSRHSRLHPLLYTHKTFNNEVLHCVIHSPTRARARAHRQRTHRHTDRQADEYPGEVAAPRVGVNSMGGQRAHAPRRGLDSRVEILLECLSPHLQHPAMHVHTHTHTQIRTHTQARTHTQLR